MVTTAWALKRQWPATRPDTAAVIMTALVILASVLLIFGPPVAVFAIAARGLALSIRGLGRALFWLRALRQGPSPSLGSTGAGEVCLEGRAELLEVQDSPVEGRECVAFSAEIRQGLCGRRRHRGSEAVRFRLVDPSGSALVEGEDVTGFYSAWRASPHRHQSDGFHPFMEEYTEDARLPPRGWLRRATEWRVEPGEAATVVGAVIRMEPDGDTSAYRQSAAVPLVGRGRAGLLVAAGSRAAVGRALRLECVLSAVQGIFSAAALWSLAAMVGEVLLYRHPHDPLAPVICVAACMLAVVGIAMTGSLRLWLRRPPVPAPRA